MRTLLPNVLLIVLCWLALYIIPSQSADRASQRLFWQFSSPAGRLLMLALLLTMEGFLEGCLGGKSEPVESAFDGSSIEILYGKGYIGNLP